MGPFANVPVHTAHGQPETPGESLAGETGWHVEVYGKGKHSRLLHSLFRQRESGCVSLGSGALVENTRLPGRRRRVLPGRLVAEASAPGRAGDAHASKP